MSILSALPTLLPSITIPLTQLNLTQPNLLEALNEEKFIKPFELAQQRLIGNKLWNWLQSTAEEDAARDHLLSYAKKLEEVEKTLLCLLDVLETSGTVDGAPALNEESEGERCEALDISLNKLNALINEVKELQTAVKGKGLESLSPSSILTALNYLLASSAAIYACLASGWAMSLGVLFGGILVLETVIQGVVMAGAKKFSAYYQDCAWRGVSDLHRELTEIQSEVDQLKKASDSGNEFTPAAKSELIQHIKELIPEPAFPDLFA